MRRVVVGTYMAVSAFALACASSSGTTPLGGGSTGWIDVTTTLDPSTTPVYEGDAPMTFEFLKDMRKGDAFTLSKYSLGAHSGTHIDAPMHFVVDGAPIERVPIERLIGSARVIEIADDVQAIDAAELNRHDWKGAPRVLFRTRSSAWLGTTWRSSARSASGRRSPASG